MKRLNAVFFLACLLFTLSACATPCGRSLETQLFQVGVNIQVPVKIREVPTEVNMKIVTENKKILPEVSRIAMFLDDHQYDLCLNSEKMPENEKKEAMADIDRINHQLDKLGVALLAPQPEVQEKLQQWIDESKEMVKGFAP